MQNITVDIWGKPSIPKLKRVGEDYAGDFLVWKTMLEKSSRTTPDRLLQDAIQRSLSEFPRAAQAIAMPTVTDIIRYVGGYYGVASNFDESLQQLYSLNQGATECVAAFAARVTDRVWLVHHYFPAEMPEPNLERVETRQLFGGLSPQLKQALAYAQPHLDGYQFTTLLDLAKAAERGMKKARMALYEPAKPKDPDRARPDRRYLPKVKALAPVDDFDTVDDLELEAIWNDCELPEDGGGEIDLCHPEFASA